MDSNWQAVQKYPQLTNENRPVNQTVLNMKSLYSRKIDFIAIVFFLCVLKQIHLQEGLQLLCSIFAVHSVTAPDHIRFLI